MVGAFRLVNPDRGTVWGSVGGRVEVTTAGEGKWEIRCEDHYPGRSFSQAEIEAWAASDPLSESELAVGYGLPAEDLLGKVPARAVDPKSWKWYSISSEGESRLKGFAKPTAEEVSLACREALEADSLESVPLVDKFELWGCDLETAEPVALLLTGVTEYQARGTFSPLWRFCIGVDHEDLQVGSVFPTRKFQERLNSRLYQNRKYACRLFERIDKGAVVELDLPRQKALTAGPIALPQALLAEPWNSEYLELRKQWESTRLEKGGQCD